MSDITLRQYQTAERALTVEQNRRWFAVHAAFYLVVNLVMIAVNLRYTPEFSWFPFPLLGWSIGLTVHYLLGVRWIGELITRRQASIEHRAARRGAGVGA
jgi:hypothetical protein